MSMRMDMQSLDVAEEPSKCVKMLYMFWKFCTCVFSHVTLVSLVVGYCLVGAVAFRALEYEHEIEVKGSIAKLRKDVTEKLWRITYEADVLHRVNWTRNVTIELSQFEHELLGKMEHEGWDGCESKESVQWSFSGALFYSIIVITTIGYGHIAPRTKHGKVVTIVYAILGIPLMLLCLSSIGDIMASSFRFLYWKVCCYVCTKPPRKRRARSARGTIRQTGRYSNRTPASFRRSVRISQRSADSALGLSESLGRSSYSDMEYRYHLEGMDLATDFPCTRPSTMSRYSDIPVSSPRVKGGRLTTGTASLDRRAMVDLNEANRTPILFNKYALGPEDEQPKSRVFKGNSKRSESINDSGIGEASTRNNSARGTGSLSRHNRLDVESLNFPRQLSQPPPEIREHHAPPVNVEGIDSLKRSMRMRRAQSYYGGGRNQRRDVSSSRFMSSPMGFPIHKQNYDDFEIDYNYTVDDNAVEVLKPVPIWLCVLLVVGYIFGGAFIFNQWEGWSFLDSAYFCFITLTTIGFGDFVPELTDNAEMSIALCSLYLLFGIALLAMSFNLVQEEVIINVKSVARRLGIIKDDEEDDDEDED